MGVVLRLSLRSTHIGQVLPRILISLVLTKSTDLKGIDQMTFHFPLGTPFRPYEQLMGVLPLASRDNIPSAYHVRIIRFVFIFTLSINPL